MKTNAASLGLVLMTLLPACAVHVETSDGAMSEGAGGAAATTIASTSSSAGSGGAPAVGTGGTPATGTGGAAACVVQPGEPGADPKPFPQTCDGLDVMKVSDPVVHGGPDGEVHPGTNVILTVDLDEIAGVGYSFYPNVEVSPISPGVTVMSNDQLYAILPCQTVPTTTVLAIDPGVPVGTTLTVRAQVAALGLPDCPNAYGITVPILVQ